MTDRSVPRRFPRCPIKLFLLYKLKNGAPVRAGTGWTHDLSEGGGCLELAERLEPASTLRLFLQTDRGGLELEGAVVWSGNPERKGGGVLHGVTFTQVAPDQYEALRKLLLEKEQERPGRARLAMERAVICHLKEKPDVSLQGRTANISRGGLLLCLPQPLPPPTMLVVTLPTQYGPVAGEGVIVWADSPVDQNPGELIRHGFRFTDVGWASELALGLLLAEGS